MKEMLYTIRKIARPAGVVILLLVILLSCENRNTEPEMQKVTAPVFSPHTGFYSQEINVIISCSTPGATIYYTMDGSIPAETSSIYSVPIQLTASDTLKAIACKTGWLNSSVATSVYTLFIVPIAATPVFSPPGGYYTSVQNVTISCATSGAEILYTTDGSTPDYTSPLYWTPIPVTSNSTIKAIAYKAGFQGSAIASTHYEIDYNPPNYGSMVRIQGATFMMGSVNGYSNEQPVHTVSVNTFYIDPYELTQADYQAVMGSVPFVNYGAGDNYPVYGVSWFRAIEYCNRRSMMENLTPCYTYAGYGTDPLTWPVNWDVWDSHHLLISCNWNADGYRLPTEAEWEFAARGGIFTHHYAYSGSNDLNLVGWNDNNSDIITHPVGLLLPNELGLYDMSGNVSEWVWDIYESYTDTEQFNPHGPSSGTDRIERGGCIPYDFDCRVTNRTSNYPHEGNWTLGLRVCRKAP